MSALPRLSPDAVTRDWSRWIRLPAAAELLGVDRDHLSRLCRDKLSLMGAAAKVRHPQDAQATWWVARHYDERLSSSSAAATVRKTLEDQGVPAAKAHEARLRALCVLEFREARAAARRRSVAADAWFPTFLAGLRDRFPDLKLSRSAVYRWDKLHTGPDPVTALVDSRGGGERIISPDAIAFFEELYLDDRQPSVAECWRHVSAAAKDHGWTWCARRTANDQLDTWIPPAKQAYHRDRAYYNSRFLPTIQQDTTRFGAGDYWVSDHTTLDFEVRIGERQMRPTLTTFQDWSTRKIVGWCLTERPSSDTILLALRDGLANPANMGGPTHVGFDNGKDYDSWLFDGRTKAERRAEKRNAWEMTEGAFRGILYELGIQIHFSPPYCPNGKSRMERWYGTLHAQLCRSMPSYVGKDTASKPDGLASRRKAGEAPTMQQAHARLGAYIEAFNRNPDHQVEDLRDDAGSRLSPSAAYAARRQHLRAFNADALNLLLLHHDRPVSVGKRGVTVTVGGHKHNYGMLAPELLAYAGTGRKVRTAYDPQDMRTVRVFDDATSKLICVAAHNQIGGQEGVVGKEALSAFHRASKARRTTLKAVGLSQLAPMASALENLHAAGNLPPVAEPSTATVQPVVTRFDGQGKEDDRQRMKQAAGAEHRRGPDCDSTEKPRRPRMPNRVLEGLDVGFGDDSVPDLPPAPTPTDVAGRIGFAPPEPKERERQGSEKAEPTPPKPVHDEPADPPRRSRMSLLRGLTDE